MSAPAAIRACFAEWRMIKGRKVLALIFEVPLEQQGEVLTVLGAPMPDAEIWCGIARLEPASPRVAEERPGSNHGLAPSDGAGASRRGKEAYANASEAGKAITRAAILCGDRDFRIWLAGEDISVSAAAQMIREACGVDSRKQFENNPEALKKFQAIDTEYRMSIGQMAEVR